MSDIDVINKLARILETHSFGDDLASTDGSDFESSELGQFITRATSATKFGASSPTKSPGARKLNSFETDSIVGTSSPKRTPFDMWQSKQKMAGLTKVDVKPKTLTENQKETLVDSLFRRNKDMSRYQKCISFITFIILINFKI